MNIKYFFISVVVIFLWGRACGQVVPRVAGLESNQQYMDMLLQEKSLQDKEDSISKLLVQTRADLRAYPDERAKYGAEILRLESEMFDLRNKIGVITGKINSMEQQYVISNLDLGNVMQNNDPGPGQASFLEYLQKKLSPQEYQEWDTANKMELPVLNFIKIYHTNYATLKELCEGYVATHIEHHADSLYARYKNLSAINASVSDTVSKLWTPLHDTKTYLYTLLMDKANNRTYLESYQSRINELDNFTAQHQNTYESDTIGLYPAQKRFVLECELQIAMHLADNKTVDSLRGAMRSLEGFAEPLKLCMEPRVFIKYEDIKIGKSSYYNDANPIPALKIYPSGSVYSIKVGDFSKEQQPSIFHNAYPVSVDITPEGRHIYFVGTLDSRQKADEAVETLRNAGFRSPEVVEWKDGQFINHTEAQRKNTSEQSDATLLWQIDITSHEATLSDAIRELVATIGEGHDISRIVETSGEQARYTFIITPYGDKQVASALAEAIRANNPALVVTIKQAATVQQHELQ